MGRVAQEGAAAALRQKNSDLQGLVRSQEDELHRLRLLAGHGTLDSFASL